ncbi:MAG: potassium transporter Kup [Bdellovibrionales bacterium]|nr:potassium transporter Kup [Bdellovibrionales bacterium]
MSAQLENQQSNSHHGVSKQPLAALSLAALGIVYGDIGTSPLYALRECFHGAHAMELTPDRVLGVLSLILWALILTVSIKYMIFILEADNRGEGGILALTALSVPARLRDRKWLLFGIGVFGAALMYGDGIITPAISVLGAVEGLKIAAPGLSPYVVPIAVAVLVILFLQQRHGTGKIGAVFGPIILVWFTALAILGVRGIIMNPEVLGAISPHHAVRFFLDHGKEGFFVLGSVFLVVTGGEALYADMGHFGRSPIRWAWFTVALPGLVLNYFGQGALLLVDPASAENPFYLLAPSWAVIPLVILATAAAVIASQALISGVFSLTKQAIQLGLSPRLQIIHTSSREIGQIYMPHVNYAMLIGTLWLVLTFKSSSNLAAAYGISVSATMVVTTLLAYVVARRRWGWSAALALTVCGFFLIVDLAFFAANAMKVAQGGWVPLTIGIVMALLMATWRKGRKILSVRMKAATPPIREFLTKLQQDPGIQKVRGVAVFMVGDPEVTPPAMVHNVKHNKVLHDKVMILTVLTEEVPYVEDRQRLKIEKIVDGVFKVEAHFGFMETPDVMALMVRIQDTGLKFEIPEITFFVGRETLIATEHPGMAIWREHIFAFMARNSHRATAFFNIPANQVIEVGMQVEL